MKKVITGKKTNKNSEGSKMFKLNRGFTLIELLVVISIIGVLASVVLVSLNTARDKARDAKRAAMVNQVKLALEYYYDDYNEYPSIGTDGVAYGWSGLKTSLAPYISDISEDPSGSTWHILQYARGPSNAYGIYIRYETKYGTSGYCKTGVNVNTVWWGSGKPVC